MTRHRNDGLRKVCGCARRAWAKCAHPWHFNFKWKGTPYRFSLDRQLGQKVKSKTEARTEADRLRSLIRDGKFAAGAETPSAGITTLEQLGLEYFKTYISPKTRRPISRNERYRWDMMMRTEVVRANGVTVKLGDLEARVVTRHDVEAFAVVQRATRTETFADSKGRAHAWRRGGVVSTNRCLGRLRAFYNWAIENGHVETTPFKRGTATVVRLFSEAERERRLLPGHGEAKSEEARLLAVANPHLHALITAALETACRVGELLSLQWHQVRWDLNEIHLPATKTKGLRTRDLPMSQRLRAVLEMRRHDPTGAEYGTNDYVFGDATGAQIKSVKTAWQAACRRADITGLNFHDLRREAGSRLLEGAVPPNIVQAFLDHANLSTTSRYLKITRVGMHAALKRFEEARESCKPVANTPPAEEQAAADAPQKSVQ